VSLVVAGEPTSAADPCKVPSGVDAIRDSAFRENHEAMKVTVADDLKLSEAGAGARIVPGTAVRWGPSLS
jgi:hypothetical protein